MGISFCVYLHDTFMINVQHQDARARNSTETMATIESSILAASAHGHFNDSALLSDTMEEQDMDVYDEEMDWSNHKI
jgi:hypothetical protein